MPAAPTAGGVSYTHRNVGFGLWWALPYLYVTSGMSSMMTKSSALPYRNPCELRAGLTVRVSIVDRCSLHVFALLDFWSLAATKRNHTELCFKTSFPSRGLSKKHPKEFLLGLCHFVKAGMWQYVFRLLVVFVVGVAANLFADAMTNRDWKHDFGNTIFQMFLELFSTGFQLIFLFFQTNISKQPLHRFVRFFVVMLLIMAPLAEPLRQALRQRSEAESVRSWNSFGFAMLWGTISAAALAFFVRGYTGDSEIDKTFQDERVSRWIQFYAPVLRHTPIILVHVGGSKLIQIESLSLVCVVFKCKRKQAHIVCKRHDITSGGKSLHVWRYSISEPFGNVGLPRWEHWICGLDPLSLFLLADDCCPMGSGFLCSLGEFEYCWNGDLSMVPCPQFWTNFLRLTFFFV